MRKVLLLSALCTSVLAAGALAPSTVRADPADEDGGGGQVVYDATVRPLPANLPSVGAEAYSFTEFGDEVTFARSARVLDRVVVTMSSWGCQAGHWYDDTCATTRGATFSVPITFNIYGPPAANTITAGPIIATTTQTFEIRYRPSKDDVHCTNAHGQLGEWYDGKQKQCFNGLAANITFDFSSQHVVLPATAVFGIAYNTSHYGPHPSVRPQRATRAPAAARTTP